MVLVINDNIDISYISLMWKFQSSDHLDGLGQERHNIANALELCLSCIDPSICSHTHLKINMHLQKKPLLLALSDTLSGLFSPKISTCSGTITWLPECRWSNPEAYGWMNKRGPQKCKLNKAKQSTEKCVYIYGIYTHCPSMTQVTCSIIGPGEDLSETLRTP